MQPGASSVGAAPVGVGGLEMLLAAAGVADAVGIATIAAGLNVQGALAAHNSDHIILQAQWMQPLVTANLSGIKINVN